MTRNTRSIPGLVIGDCTDLRLFRFDACDDDDEFYVRAPSRSAAFRVLTERGRVKRLRLQPRTCTALDVTR